MRRSASANAACSAAGAQTVSAKPSRRAEIGDRDRDRARAADDDLRPRQHRLDEDVHGALARAHVLDEAHAVALVAGRDALRLQHVGRLHRDEPRLAVGERLARRLEHRGAGAAAADPAFRDRAVGQDHRLGAGLGGGGRDGAHHGRERERLALRLQREMRRGCRSRGSWLLPAGQRSRRGRSRSTSARS